MSGKLLVIGLLLLVSSFSTRAIAGDDVPAGDRGLSAEDTATRFRKLEERLRRQEEEIRELRSALDRRRSPEGALEAEIDRYLAKADDGFLMSEPGTFRSFWRTGLNFETSDKRFRLKFGGRIMDDWGWFGTESDVDETFGSFANGTEFRRARLYMAGTIYDNVEFKGQYEFAGGSVAFKDAYVGLKNVPYLGTVRVGNHYEPLGLETLTSSKYITFMERGLIESFVPSRSNGISARDSALDGNLFWAAGVFHDTGGAGDGVAGKNVTVRIAGTPLNEDKGERLVHLGVAYSRRDPVSDTFRVRARPEAHMSSHRVVDTGTLDADVIHLLGLEAAAVFGPFSAQGEYVSLRADSESGDDPSLSGFYLYASYFLTGEHRPYKTGTFSRVKPSADFDGKGGLGAFEVGLRYSQLDLDDGDTEGGEVRDWTLGMNWYLNPNTRVMLNYVLSDVSGVGDLDIFMVRFQIDF